MARFTGAGHCDGYGDGVDEASEVNEISVVDNTDDVEKAFEVDDADGIDEAWELDDVLVDEKTISLRLVPIEGDWLDEIELEDDV